MNFHESGKFAASPILRDNIKRGHITVLACAKNYTGTRNERIKKFIRDYYPTYADWYDLNGWYQCDVTKQHLIHYEKQVINKDKQIGKKPGPVKGTRHTSGTVQAQRNQVILDELRAFCRNHLHQNKRLLSDDIANEFNWCKKTVTRKMKEHVRKR